MAKKVSQMIEQQVQLWTLKNSSEHKRSIRDHKLPIITVSREFGAKGAAIATKLGEELGFKVWDKDILNIISEKLQSSKDFIQSLDEKHRNLLEDTIFGFMRHKGTNLNYLIQLVRTVRGIEKYGNSIIVGRGANYICQKPNSFHVRVVAPIKTRVERYAEHEGISREDAYATIVQKDAERTNFIKYNFNRDVANPEDYDLLVNSASFTIGQIVEIIAQAYEIKTGEKTAVKKPVHI